MPTCPNGHEVDASVAFCRQCGASIAPMDEPTVVLAPVPTAPPARTRAARPAQSNTAVYVLAGIIVLVGLVGIGLALLLGSNNDTGGPPPISQTVTTPTSGSSPTASQSPTASAIPAGGTRCPGTVDGSREFGTIGSETSCGFVQAVFQSYIGTATGNEAQGQSTTVSATSPATHRTYRNIVCTVGAPWVTCVGGNNDTARMFFARP